MQNEQNNKNITKGKGRKKDFIYNYFNIIDDKICCNIDDCKNKFSKKTSTSILKYHILIKHNKTPIQNIANNDIDSKMNDSNENDLYYVLSLFFAKNSLPHSLIEDKYFRNVMETIKKSHTIDVNKKKLREIILLEGKKINDNILNKLGSSEQPVTMAIDGWTNVRSNKVTNILLISNGISYYYTSIENVNCQNKTEWIVSKLEERIKFLISKKINIIALTTDNENLMKSVRKEIKNKFPVILDVPCASHIIQLCLKKMCDIDKIKNLIENVNNIVHFIRNNKKNKTTLYQLQIDDSIKDPLSVIYPIETRWSSIINCIDRLLKLQKYISIIATEFKKPFWDKLLLLYNFLKPIEIYTDQIQKDEATLYSVWLYFNKMIDFYKSKEIPVEFTESANTAVDIIQSNWNNHININIINASRLFNFEINFNGLNNTIEFIINWGTIYLITYNIVTDVNDENIKNILRLQMSDFLAKQKEFSYVNNIIEKTKRACDIKKTIYSPKNIWGMFIASHYELSKVAIGILSIYPSESCVERSFSAQTDVHSLERNRLTSDIIEAEMNIKMNI